MWRVSDPVLPGRVSRRTALHLGALGTVGLSWPQLLEAEGPTRRGESRSLIVIVPWGGPSQHDTFDPKPLAPKEIRSPFEPIETVIPGVRFGEHLPSLARMADRFAVIRSMTHKISTHNPATHYFLTGRQPAVTNRELVPASRSDWPSIGSLLSKALPSETAVPSYVQLPLPLIDNGSFTGGQHAGFMSPAHDPFVISEDPNRPDFRVPALALPREVTEQRLAARRKLIDRLDASPALSPAHRHLDVYYERAYDLLLSSASHRAFDIGQESAATRERYGRTRFAQSVLLARRMVEAGVRLVLVCDTTENTNGKWDTHGGGNSDIAKSLQESDKAIAALLTDLDERDLAGRTVVAWMAEFGRTPTVRANGGRDHWPHVYSLLLAGAGIRGGVVHGSSDAQGAYPRDNPVAPEDVLATLYSSLGLNPHTLLHDPQGRPFPLTDGHPVRAVMC